MILQFNKLKIKVNKGAIIKIILFDNTGIIVSLTINLTASAIGCNKPKKPTKFGPRRFWILPKTFLSIKIAYATNNNKHKTTTKAANTLAIKINISLFQL